jgi:hypothetical protein
MGKILGKGHRSRSVPMRLLASTHRIQMKNKYPRLFRDYTEDILIGKLMR